MSPGNDCFVSVSADKTARIWDLRSPNCQGLTQPSSPPVLVRMDPKGLVFATATLRKTLLLYDLRSYDKGPFYEFSIPISSAYGPPEPHLVESSSVSSFEFSPDGKKVAVLALNQAEIVVSVLDSFEGRVYSCISSPTPWGYLEAIKDPDLSSQQMRINLSGTPNSNYFVSFMAKRRFDLNLQAWRFDN
ncbi:hypothetical protein HZS_7734, partial [Henneguya salminicola]